MQGIFRVRLFQQPCLVGQLSRLSAVAKDSPLVGLASSGRDQSAAAPSTTASVLPSTLRWYPQQAQIVWSQAGVIPTHRGFATEVITSQPPEVPTAQQIIKVAFIGAGGINFGSAEGPWNHAKHISALPDVEVVGVSDINTRLAEQRIQEKQQGPEADKWSRCQAFKHYRELIRSNNPPDAVIIGVPPDKHGGLSEETCMELDFARAGIHMFVEKPVSVQSADEVGKLSEQLEACYNENGAIITAGYMLRYSAWVDQAKRLLKLATHFVDLMRYICGEIREDTIRAVAVGPNMKLGDLPAQPKAEHMVPMERRINRATAATFHFEEGAIGSLYHSVVLEGARFTAELDIFCDGVHIVIGNPYYQPFLRVRRTRREDYEQTKLEESAGADMYAKEFETFIEAIRSGDRSKLKSTYPDAARSYQCTKWITEASVQTAQSATGADKPWIVSAKTGEVTDAPPTRRQNENQATSSGTTVRKQEEEAAGSGTTSSPPI
ncbi:hypothetical protein WJX84_000989 [Apatococcus fuscideae]|uniref:Gfo/Idh/MocA-like oxidoreductase N-terminal domain-containing protein n=1 Tax=Apatococcus fuscideae TaxID=2026836 RepID=A0AAW1S167_9CHLO